MDIISFVILSFATCRLGSLFAREPGPFDILDRFRYILGARYNELNEMYGTTMLSRMILCMHCNTIWIGTILAVLYLIFGIYVMIACLPFAISAAALFIDNNTFN